MRTERNWLFIILTASFILTAGCDDKPQQQNQQPPRAEGEQSMEPAISNLEPFTVMGISNRMSISEESSADYAKIWSEFERYNEQLKKISTNGKYYGITFATEKQNIIDYVIAMAVPEKAAPLDKKLVVRLIPAAQYAVFDCPVQNIGQTKQYIITKWLPNAPYKITPQAPSFEQYPPEDQDKLPVRIHIPVTKKPAK
ncbi:MAG: GyrI-like domain-containing protein [Sedimentisphaerales bacterium]|nr:GyrI-like domain-containing protein [Sedimentisphaerales bacterium]